MAKRSMTNKDRYEDIARISGLSENIVKRVLSAETESTLNSLKRGENVNLIGRCTLMPEIRSKLVVGGELEEYIMVKAKVTNSLNKGLEGLKDFENNGESTEDDITEEGIRLMQIPSLV